MQLSLEKLQAMSEADLRRKVLIPLFRAMGFHDVTELHGSRELGKDIVMWKEDPFRDRENFAVVVKAQKITTGSQSTTVARQIRECLGSAYTDPVSLEERIVDRVIVVTSKEFTAEARDSIRSERAASQPDRRVDLFGGEKLFELVRKYLPEAVLWDPLQKASKALKEASDNWDFTLKIDPDGVTSVFVTDRHPESQTREPIAGSMTFRFPPTPEGMQKRAEYQRHLETGTPVEFSAEHIESFEIPEFLRSLTPGGETNSLILGPSPLAETMLHRLLVLDETGAAVFSFDYIHFTHRQGGSKETSIDNRGQLIPFRVKIIFDRESDKAKFDINFEPKGANVTQQLRWLFFRAAAARGDRIVFADWNSGLPLFGWDLHSIGAEAPSNEQVELTRRLVYIQERTGVELVFGEANTLTTEDIAYTDFVVSALHQGVARLPASQISFPVEDSASLDDKVGTIVKLRLNQREFEVEILKSRISLGSAEILCRGTLRKLPAGEGEQQFSIEASDSGSFMVVFPQWLPSQQADSSTTSGGGDSIDRPEE